MHGPRVGYCRTFHLDGAGEGYSYICSKADVNENQQPLMVPLSTDCSHVIYHVLQVLPGINKGRCFIAALHSSASL